MSVESKYDGRRFLGAAVMSMAAAELSMTASADAQSDNENVAALPPIKPGTNTSFGPLKQIDAGLLNIGYAEVGPSSGPAAILLHGWPHKIAAARIAAISGCSLEYEIYSTSQPPGDNLAQTVVTASTWPRSLRPHTRIPAPAVKEMNFVLAIRIFDVNELWYLIADSFNLRKTLGAEAGYSTEANLRILVRRLVLLAPSASRDKFVTALKGGLPLPSPLTSLSEFFRIAARR